MDRRHSKLERRLKTLSVAHMPAPTSDRPQHELHDVRNYGNHVKHPKRVLAVNEVTKRRAALARYLSIPKLYNVNFSVFVVDARCGDVNSHRGAPSRGLEWAGFEAASATDPAGRRTVHFPMTLPFSKPTLRMTPIYVISDISRWRECCASEVGCY